MWGDAAERKRVKAKWREVPKWNEEAKASGVRRKVFCASLADVFDLRAEHGLRADLFKLIHATPYLDWLLLTKRPEHVRECLEKAREIIKLRAASDRSWDAVWFWLDMWLQGNAPFNVWLGATAESQEWADKRMPLLLNLPAAIHFVSAEPLLGPVSFRKWMKEDGRTPFGVSHPLDWVIAGGESGKHDEVRVSNPKWFRRLRDECKRTGTPYFFKQWGEWGQLRPEDFEKPKWDRLAIFDDEDYADTPCRLGDLAEPRRWFEHLQPGDIPVILRSKELNGNLLDGEEWKQQPDTDTSCLAG